VRVTVEILYGSKVISTFVIIAAILDLQFSVRSGSVGSSSLGLVNLTNVGIAVEIIPLSIT